MAKLNISKAIKKPGALHKQLGVPKGEKIPAKKLNAAAKKGGKLGERARFAKTLQISSITDGGHHGNPQQRDPARPDDEPAQAAGDGRERRQARRPG